jgi:hypothetical protein
MTNVPALIARALVGCLLLGGLPGPAWAEGIYTCVDSKGRRLTADRPIAECMDREQRELNASGTLKRKIGPSLTAQERAAEEAKARKAAEEGNRVAEEKKRNRALLARYPDRATHDKERAAALDRANEAIEAAHQNTQELVAARKRLDTELEFYRKDPAKVPAKLKREIEENQEHTQAQRRFIGNQDSEKRRINAQFDEELARLKELWAQSAAPAASTVPAAARRLGASPAVVR